MSTTLTEIIRDMVFNSGVPAKGLAVDIQKSYTTLLRELNPDDEGCKLGVDLLEPLMRGCGDVSPLRHLALSLGYGLIPLHNVEPDKPTLSEEMCDDLQAVAAYHKSLMEADPLETVGRRLEQAKAELEENYVLYRRQSFKRAG